MPARSIGNGTLSFGMVSIPIRLYSAGESKSAVSFNLLHDKCKSRLKQQYVCPKDNEVVTRDHMVKGYEFTKDQYVSFTDDEIKQMAEESQKAIEITEFVPASEVENPVGVPTVIPATSSSVLVKLTSAAFRFE